MFVFLRLVGLLVIIVGLGSLAMFFFTGDPRYRVWAWRTLQVGVALALVIMGFYVFERLFLGP